MRLRTLLLAVLALVLIVSAGLYVLISSEAGSSWLLRRAISVMPGTASVKVIEGRLLDCIGLSEIHLQTDTVSIGIEYLVFNWRASQLLLGNLDIVDFKIHGINVHLNKSETKEDASAFELPAKITLPLELTLENFLLTDLNLDADHRGYRLDKLHLSARTENDLLYLSALQLDARPLVVAAQGKIALSHGFPLVFTANWRNLQWPLAGSAPQLQSGQGSIELTGLLNDYRIALKGSLTHPGLPKADLKFDGKGSLDAMVLEKMELKSEAGSFQLTGDVSWRNATVFDLVATGLGFNPEIMLSGIPGSLAFNARIQGRLDAGGLDLSANLERLHGKLRGYPVDAEGRLSLFGKQLRIDGLRVVSGANRLAADGRLAPRQSHFEVTIEAPELNQVWPKLEGSLNGGGLMEGDWKKPLVKFRAKGKGLRWGEHQMERLAVDIDYGPEPKRISTLSLSAIGIKSGAVEISKMFVDGKGTQADHRLIVDIRSPHGEIASEMIGSLHKPSWRGRLARLDLKSRDFGDWRLEKAVEIAIGQTDAGIDADMKNACLIREKTSVCTQGRYRASGDFDAKLTMMNAPLSLVQGWLPKTMTIEGLLNGEADVARRKNVLAGRYRMELPEGLAIHLQTRDGIREVNLGISSLSGKIAGEIVSAELKLAMQNQDYVRGKLEFNTGKTQAIAGHLTASLVEFDWLKPFVPGLTAIEGDLKADLVLAGTLGKPKARGLASFSDGSALVSGHRIDQIQLQAASGDETDRIHIRGSARSGDASVQLDGMYRFDGDFDVALNAPAVPLSLLQPYLPEQTAVHGTLKADAEIHQRKGRLTGRYRVDMPPGTAIIIKSEKPVTPIALGASMLTGQISGSTFSAEFDLGLVNRDFIRGQLQLDAGEAQTLDGRITASIAELSRLNALTPRLSGIQGRINADLTVRGTMAQPNAEGFAELTQGSVDVAELGLRLREINLKSFIPADHSQRIQITGSARSGKGAVRLKGFALLETGWPVELELTGKQFEIVKLPEAEIAVSPELKLTTSQSQNQVTGRLKVDRAKIELKQLPENSVQVSADEIILGGETAREGTSMPFQVNANVEVDLDNKIRFTGLGLESELAGKLQVNKSDEKITMYGNVDMKNARYRSYGQDLTVRKGRFLFNGPADNPWLDVEAIRVSKNKKVTAILGLSGPAKSPKTRISSEPALPETEALAYLITGNSLNQASQSDGHMIAGAALSYGLGKASWLTDKLGLDEYGVEEGENLQDTLVNVGRYLNPDFYVGAKVGLFNRQTSLILKHKLTDSLNVESETGESQRVKLNYEFDMD